MHPHCVTSDINNEWLRQLIRKLRDYARYWYDCCKGPGSSKPNRKNVYGRIKCGFCNNEISLIRDGVLQRITYLCSKCQLFPLQHDIVEKKKRENLVNNVLPQERMFLPGQGKIVLVIKDDSANLIDQIDGNSSSKVYVFNGNNNDNNNNNNNSYKAEERYENE